MPRTPRWVKQSLSRPLSHDMKMDKEIKYSNTKCWKGDKCWFTEFQTVFCASTDVHCLSASGSSAKQMTVQWGNYQWRPDKTSTLLFWLLSFKKTWVIESVSGPTVSHSKITFLISKGITQNEEMQGSQLDLIKVFKVPVFSNNKSICLRGTN